MNSSYGSTSASVSLVCTSCGREQTMDIPAGTRISPEALEKFQCRDCQYKPQHVSRREAFLAPLRELWAQDPEGRSGYKQKKANARWRRWRERHAEECRDSQREKMRERRAIE
jgi:hypothetical protein